MWGVHAAETRQLSRLGDYDRNILVFGPAGQNHAALARHV
jgi:hypothetical protein